ncbi:M23 family metallopeptidase [Aquimarina sp. W85]|uniref:M23 family metallopeptidase n=1 Tax=Aquimarina rhodophyticola TaxID=3342246 RepID=UPI00366D1BA8
MKTTNGNILIRTSIVLLMLTIQGFSQASSRVDDIYMKVPIKFPLDTSDFEKISSVYGYRLHPIYNNVKMHHGIDLVAKKGKPVFATGSGIIEVSDYDTGYGNRILIAHGSKIKTLYAHLWIKMVTVGEKVHNGQLIGFVGDTGRVTGTHLHYEVWFKNKRINPMLIWKNFYAKKSNSKKYKR